MGAAILGSAGNILLLLLLLLLFVVVVVVAPLPSGVGRGWVAGRGCRWLGVWVGRRRGAWGVPIDRARLAASIRRLAGGIRSNPGKFMSTVHDRRYSRLVRVALVLRVLFPARGHTLPHSGDPPHPAPRPPLLSAICRATWYNSIFEDTFRFLKTHLDF